MVTSISNLVVAGAAAMLAAVACGCIEHRVPPAAARANAFTAEVLLAAAGDIADCGHDDGEYAVATAHLLRQHPEATVLALGDLAYRDGSREDFAGCYERTWGAVKNRTRPAPGNHDYGIYGDEPRSDAAPYFEYFGERAGPEGKGYYSFDLGAWHIVSLNSMAGVEQVLAATPSMDEQARWLEEDLNRTKAPCILAFWHHPLFSSGRHGHDPRDPGRAVRPLWDTLAAHGADLILNGHDHDYERFAPQTANGIADRAHGIRQIVVGTGGAKFRRLKDRNILPNSEARLDDDDDDHGVLLVRLHPQSYEWQFVRTDGSIGDVSARPEACHAKAGR